MLENMEEKNLKKKMNNREKKALIDKYERPYKKTSFKDKKEMYLKQTDRNYKDGDRN